MTMSPAELQAKCRAVARVLDHVGEDELAASFWAAVATCKALEDAGNPNFETDMLPVVDALDEAINVTTLKTSDLFNKLRDASFSLLDVVGPYWHHLADRWAKRRTKLREMWQVPADAARAFADIFKVNGGVSDTEPGYVRVYPDAASSEFVLALQQLSAEHPALRLMFIEAADPDVVYAAAIHDEEVVTSMLSPYTRTLWRGTAQLGNGSEVSEFIVYNVNGHRIFRVPGTLAACDKSVLDLLVTGELIPRMASTKTASVLRLTFSLRAVANPEFKDFLRSLGGEPSSPVSWDVPILQESDIESTFSLVRERFGYPVMLYQIVDTPKQNIWAFTNPEAQVMRVLSAPTIKTVTTGNYKVRTPKTSDISARLASAIASGKLSDSERMVVERVAGACRVVAHALVALKDELTGHDDNLPGMFPGVRVDTAASAGIYVIPRDGYTQLVTSEALAPQSTALEEEAAGPCECEGADCSCEDATSEEDWILNISMGNPAEYHEGEGTATPSMYNSPAADQLIGPDLASGDEEEPAEESVCYDDVSWYEDHPQETPEATEVEHDRAFEDPADGGDGEAHEQPETILDQIAEGLPEPIAQIIESLPVCETCSAPYGSNPECSACNSYYEQVTSEESDEPLVRGTPNVNPNEEPVEAAIDDTDFKAVEAAVSAYLRTVPGVDVHEVQHFEDDAGKGITWTADLYDDAIGQLGMSAPTGPSIDSGLAVTVAHNDDDSFWVSVSSNDESRDHAMVVFEKGKSRQTASSEKPMRNELAAEVMKFMIANTSAGETVEAESGLGLNNPAVHEMNAAEGEGGQCLACGAEYGANIDCPECLKWEPGARQAAPNAVHVKFQPFTKPRIYGDTSDSVITVNGTNYGAIIRNMDMDFVGMSRTYAVSNYEVQLYGGDLDVEKTFELQRDRKGNSLPGAAKKALAEAKAFVRKTIADAFSAPVTVDTDAAKPEPETAPPTNPKESVTLAGTKLAGKPDRTIGYEKAKQMSEQTMLSYIESFIKSYDRQSHNPLGGQSDDISPIEVLPHDAEILYETGAGPTWRAIIDYPNKRRMAVIYRMQGRNYPSMLYFAGDTKVPRKAAFMEDILNVFYKTVEALKKTPHIDSVTVHKGRNPGFGAATITVAPDSLDVFGLNGKKMNKGTIEVDVFAYDDGIANVQVNADDKTVVTHIDDGVSRVSRKSPGVSANLVGLASQITKPMTEVSVPKAATQMPTTVTAASVKLDKVEKDKVNASMRKRGFDGNVRFRSLGSALAEAEKVLNDFGFEFDDITTKGMLYMPEGTRSLDIAKTGEDAFSPVPVNNSSLFFQWSKYGDTADYSVVAYLG